MISELQKEFLLDRGRLDLSNAEAIVLQALSSVTRPGQIVARETIIAIASTRYQKAESSVYHNALLTLKHFGLVKPYIRQDEPDDHIDDFYEITDEGRKAIADLLGRPSLEQGGPA
jgi:hypothetical protein